MALIGQRNLLSVVREAPPGLYLDGENLGEILLPGKYKKPIMKPGVLVDVFVCLDSEDRLVATTETPLAMVGEFARLEVVDIHQQAGAFLAWGLGKDLLLPFREQVGVVRVGDKVVVFLLVDEKSNRIVATMRLHRHLSKPPLTYRKGQRVGLFIAEKTALGYRTVVDNAYEGLLYHDSLQTPVEVGQRMEGFIRSITDSGKIDLSLDEAGYQRVGSVRDQILAKLKTNGGSMALNDESPPDAIRAAFGVSKKSFKQALGALYKARKIRLMPKGVELMEQENVRSKSGRKPSY